MDRQLGDLREYCCLLVDCIVCGSGRGLAPMSNTDMLKNVLNVCNKLAYI